MSDNPTRTSDSGKTWQWQYDHRHAESGLVPYITDPDWLEEKAFWDALSADAMKDIPPFERIDPEPTANPVDAWLFFALVGLLLFAAMIVGVSK